MEDKFNVEELIISIKSINLENIINAVSKYENTITESIELNKGNCLFDLENFENQERMIFNEMQMIVSILLKLTRCDFEVFVEYIKEKSKHFLIAHEKEKIDEVEYIYCGERDQNEIKSGHGYYKEKLQYYEYFGGWKDNNHSGDGILINTHEEGKEIWIGNFNNENDSFTFKGLLITLKELEIVLINGVTLNKGEKINGLYVSYDKMEENFSIYHGTLLDFKKHGNGLFVKVNNLSEKMDFNVYIGEYNVDKKKGEFKIYMYDNYLLNAKFEDNLQCSSSNDNNIIKYKNDNSKSIYIGQIQITLNNNILRFAKEGRGIMIYSNNSFYIGNFEFRDGKSLKNSKGEYYVINGENDSFYIKGEYKDDEIQEGEIYLGKKLNKNLKLLFRGKFEKSEIKQGLYNYENGTYEGSFKNKLRDGYGKYLYNTGAIFEGNWVQDKREGKGRYKYSANDNFVEYTWSNDQILYPKSNNQ